MLLGQPKSVPVGSLTVKDLAAEAQIGRFHLYQKHPDLRDRFEFLRDRANRPSEKEAQLGARIEEFKAEIDRLRKSLSETALERDNWKALAEMAVRATAVLQEETVQAQRRAERLARRLERATSAATPSTVVRTLDSYRGRRN
ncbi:DUF5930 domain-containing protein [Actinoplanes subtropicus]|uniref:DUF5930 domain-containing protein n=1 Tax=Actinoplanes subtropicus TaxID=543632 RepID=UPI0012FA46A9|nr:DUF5930 domain-containing protein [Actinoplanes subtropicus]